jgi:hypothetical protein
MSELDTGLEELRADLRAGIRRPDLGHVAGRARRQKVRRRTQIGSIVAVVLVIAVVPLLRSAPADDNRPANPSPDYTYEVDFADADHGYALGSDCVTNELCWFTLLATTDGGRSWQPRTLPKASGRYKSGGMHVFGPNQVVFSLVGEDGAPGGEFISDDAGRTWRGWSGLRASETATAIPAGASLMHICLDYTAGGGCVSGLGATVPDKGEVSPTPTQPPLVRPLQAGGVPTAGGRYWAAGKDASSGRWAIAVSSDAGVTWATTQLDVPGEPSTAGGDAWSVVEQGRVMYATVRGVFRSRTPSLLAVFRSTDKGLSWTTVAPVAGVEEMTGSPIATTDGRLIVYSGVDGTLESTDGGRTFTRSSVRLPGKVTWTRGGYLAYRPEHGWAISRDGVNWRTLTLP